MDSLKNTTKIFEQFYARDVKKLGILETEDFFVSLAALCAVYKKFPKLENDEDPILLELAEKVISNALGLIAESLLPGDPKMADFIWRRTTMLAEQRSFDAFDKYGFQNPFNSVNDYNVDAEDVDYWPWPIIFNGSTNGSFSGLFQEFSALKMFGYTVGKSNGWPQKKRHKFLKNFMEKKLPERVTEIFGDEYGQPLSAIRLKKVANLIASVCQLRYKTDRFKFKDAIADWEIDLAFLKKEYFEGRALKFTPWPQSRSPY